MFQIFASFQVAGIALIVVGAIPLFKLEDIRDAFPENNPAILPIAVLVLGSVIFTISFFGCCGAIRESQCMVSTVSLLKSFWSSSMINFCHPLVCLLLACAGRRANRNRGLRFHVHWRVGYRSQKWIRHSLERHDRKRSEEPRSNSWNPARTSMLRSQRLRWLVVAASSSERDSRIMLCRRSHLHTAKCLHQRLRAASLRHCQLLWIVDCLDRNRVRSIWGETWFIITW